MPHCVLTLRLIGLAFDLADGTLPEEKLSKDMKRLAIKPENKPDIIEIATFVVRGRDLIEVYLTENSLRTVAN